MEFLESDLKPGNRPRKSNVEMPFESVNTKYESNSPAVFVNDANKTYGNGPPILKNFSMTVQRGTIYGLLGASGCGKTTILSCIVGLMKLDSGDVKVFGAVPGTKENEKTIGYMPQEIALYETLTIKEVLQYYGRIYGMKQSEIQARMEFLLNFLDLPDCFRRISELSGGQQRRTSLAVAMIHQPEILILDEPTVGVDPLVRESIWQHLCEIVAQRKTTVIITTHYIEEARQSNMIGLMRNGRLLTENPPSTLMEEHNATLLEDIVLKLCKKDNLMIDGSNDHDEVAQAISETSFYSKKKISALALDSVSVQGVSYKLRRYSNDFTIIPPLSFQVDRRREQLVQTFGNDMSSHTNKIASLAVKNFLTLLRYPTFLFVLLVIPTIQIIIFHCIISSDPKHSSMGVVNHEFTSANYMEICEHNPISCFNDKLSCNFLTTVLPENIKWIPFASEKEALGSVQRGRTFGYISIPHNFSRNLQERSIWKNFATNESLEGSEIAVHLDKSPIITAEFIRIELYNHYLEFIKSLASDCGSNSRALELPMKYNPIYGTADGGRVEYMQAGHILIIIFFLPMLSSVTYIWDKKAGTLDRTMIAGVGFYHILVALIISEGFMIFLELGLAFGVLIFILEFNILGSFILAFLLCLLQGITGLAFGFLLGTLLNQEIEFLISIIGIFFPVFTSSGTTWPLESVVGWFRPICMFMPATFPIEALRSIVTRGLEITHPHVYHGFGSLICWTVLCCFLSGVVHRMKK